MSSTILFNVAMAFADAASLVIIQKHRTSKIVLGQLLCLFLAAILLALIFGENGFDHMRLMAYALFEHGTLVCIVGAFILFRSSKGLALSLTLLAASLTAITVHAFFIEPKQLEITNIQLNNPKIRTPFKIVVFSDLQADSWGDYERKAFELALQEKPDLILLTGDYFQVEDEAYRTGLIQSANLYLRGIGFRAPLGIYAVEGDVDNDDWTSLFTGTDVKAFMKTNSFNAGELQITALARSDSRNIRFSIPKTGKFHIVFGHSPNFALGEISADLLIAGHTHGGQVRLPLIGPLYIHSKIPRSWAAGLTTLSGNRKLIVSRGIGMERGNAPRLRFLCRPEIVVVEVTPSPKL